MPHIILDELLANVAIDRVAVAGVRYVQIEAIKTASKRCAMLPTNYFPRLALSFFKLNELSHHRQTDSHRNRPWA
jgi:hypothetical protein